MDKPETMTERAIRLAREHNPVDTTTTEIAVRIVLDKPVIRRYAEAMLASDIEGICTEWRYGEGRTNARIVAVFPHHDPKADAEPRVDENVTGPGVVQLVRDARNSGSIGSAALRARMDAFLAQYPE